MMHRVFQKNDSAVATKIDLAACHENTISIISIERHDAPPTSAECHSKCFDLIATIPVGVLSIADQAIVSATGFASAVIVARLMPPDQLGMYYLTLSIVLILVGIQDQLIAAPYLLYSKRHQGADHAANFGSTWFHHLLLSVVTVCGLLVAIAVLSAIGMTNSLPALWATTGVIVLLLLREDIRRFAFADLHLYSALGVDATVAVTQIGGLLLLGYFDRLSLLNIFAMMGGSCALASLGWFLFDRPKIQFVVARFRSDWQQNWTLSKWALPSYLLSSATPYFMIMIVTYAVGPAAAGVYGVCVTLIGVIRVIQGGVTNVLTPQCAQAYYTGGWHELSLELLRAARFLGLALGAVCLVFFATGDKLVVLVFGEFYQGTGTMLFTLSLAALITSLGIVVGNGLWVIDLAPRGFWADIFSTVVTLIAAALLIVPMGPLGAALATLAGAVTATAIRFAILMHAFLTRDLPANSPVIG